MIIKKTYHDNTYAIFKLLDIKFEYSIWWLSGLVIESTVDNIIPADLWDFELTSRNCKYEVIEV